MFGDHAKSVQQTVLYLASLVLLAVGTYSLGMTTVNVITNSRYSLSQSITARMSGSAAMLGVPYFDAETSCEEMYGRPYPGITLEEQSFQTESKERCMKRMDEQRRQARTMDVAHSVFLLLLGGGAYALSRKKHG